MIKWNNDYKGTLGVDLLWWSDILQHTLAHCDLGCVPLRQKECCFMSALSEGNACFSF